MREDCRWLSAITLVMLVALNFTSAVADDASAASAHMLQAEKALERDEYLKAAIEYRKAAELSGSPEVARKATRIGFTYKFNDEALLAAKRWVKLDKDSDEARLYLAQLYFRVDDLRNSRRQFERLIKTGEQPPGDRLLLLVSYLGDEGMPKRADKLIRTMAKPYKDSWSAHYAVAMVALQAGDSEHAMERALRASELDPDNIRPQLLYARALLFQGQEEQAIEYLAHIIGDNPHPEPDARMELALMYMLTGRDEDALSQVNQVLLEQGGRIDALRLMAIINFRLERLDAAWDDFQDLLATGQYRMDALYYLARIADYREEYERAVRFYREVRSGTNTIPSQRRASALLAHQLENIEAAFQLLDDFAKSSPNKAVEMVLAKAQLMASLGRNDEALEYYDKATKYRPDNESMALGRADLLLHLDRLDDALLEYRRAVKHWPKSALSLNALGYTLADRTEEYAEAEKLIRKALKYDPDSPPIIDSLGWVLFKRGRYEEALVQLQRAYKSLNDQEVAAHVVEVMAVLERRDEALELLLVAEQKDPDSELLKDVRERYFSGAP